MTGFAVFCAAIYDPKQKAFLDFALSMLAFAFSGMLAVFLAGLFTRRGNNASVIGALATGFGLTLLMQDFVLGPITRAAFGTPVRVAFTYAMPIATLAALGVCLLGSPSKHPPRAAGLHDGLEA